jgi:hypothetical protein
MTLPVRELPQSSVTLGQDTIEFRSLTMKEADGFRRFEDDTLGASAFIVSTATGVSLEDAETWLGSVTFGDANELVTAILSLSGLTGDDDPKPSGSEAS